MAASKKVPENALTSAAVVKAFEGISPRSTVEFKSMDDIRQAIAYLRSAPISTLFTKSTAPRR